jgi:hypothetical protein
MDLTCDKYGFISQVCKICSKQAQIVYMLKYGVYEFRCWEHAIHKTEKPIIK